MYGYWRIDLKKKKKLHSKKGKKRSKSTALAVTPHLVYVQGKEHRLDEKEVQLVRDLCAKGADEQEFQLFMQICRKSKLDPFLKQIYCIIWPTDQGRSHTMVIITGIGGYRMMAARDHADYGGASSATFTWFDPPKTTPAGKRIPESATVEVYSKVGPPITATVYWEELAPKDLTDKRADFWNRMPKNQLEKCAEAKG